jgi:hypothetical protein
MEIEKRYAEILAKQAAAKDHQELLMTLIRKEEFCQEFLIFTKIEMLERIKN